MRKAKSTCRICINCGFEFEIEDNRIVSAKPDRDYAMSHGYACTKGFDFIRFHRGEGVPRLLQSRRRETDGSFSEIDASTAIDEIAERIRGLIERYGPRSVAFYAGTGSYANTIGYGMYQALIHAIRTPCVFSTVTIDQPQKVITPSRMGYFLGGKRSHHDVDVMLTVGNNPLVSHLGNPLTPSSGLDPGRAARAARERGAKHIVVDPRRTETARRADLHLAVIPGEDATLIAGIAHVILQNGWHNQAFCDRWVRNVERLRECTSGFTPEHVAARCGVRAEDVIEAARLFGHAQRPMAGCGTGTCMSPHSNLADFLVEALNALCGGYRQENERVRNRGLLFGFAPVADVLPPDRSWEREPRCRSADAGQISGEFPTPLLPDEILSSAGDRIRALIVFSGNPAVAIVDPDRTLAALDALDLLVTLDHRDTETTERSHYVIATSTFYERHELSGYVEMMFDQDFIDYSRPILEKPGDVIHDWEFFWELARRIGTPLQYKYLGLLMRYEMLPPGLDLDTHEKPRDEDIIAWICRQRGLSYDDLAASSGGIVLDLPPLHVAAAPSSSSGCRLDVCPDDIATELQQVRGSVFDHAHAYRLTSRRLPQVMNSLFRGDPRLGDSGLVNFAHMNPDDMLSEGIKDGDSIEIASRHGCIVAGVKADATVRPSVISVAHGFSGPQAARVGRLVPLADGYREPISFMPHQSGVPVNLRRIGDAA